MFWQRISMQEQFRISRITNMYVDVDHGIGHVTPFFLILHNNLRA